MGELLKIGDTEISYLIQKVEAARAAYTKMKEKGYNACTPHQAKINSIANTNCPFDTCDGSGIIYYREDNSSSFCKCHKLLIQQNKMRFADIPEEFSQFKINDFLTEVYDNEESRAMAYKAKKIAIEYVKKFELIKPEGKGLYFYSNSKGSGKTRLAASIGNALIKQHCTSVKFITTVNLIYEIQNTFSENKSADNNSFSNLLEAVKRVDVLILDDLGAERPTSWVNEIFNNILNDRMVTKKITLFTSNCRIEELQHDDRLINRIMKMAMPVKFPDKSIRTVLARQENNELMRLLMEG